MTQTVHYLEEETIPAHLLGILSFTHVTLVTSSWEVFIEYVSKMECGQEVFLSVNVSNACKLRSPGKSGCDCASNHAIARAVGIS